MATIGFDRENANPFIQQQEIEAIKDEILAAKKALVDKTGAGNDYVGWVDLPIEYDREEYDRIKKAAEKIRQDSDVLLVIGIGGSYLGARAVNEALSLAGLSDAFHIGGAYFRKLENENFGDLWRLRLKGVISEYFRGEPDAKDKIQTVENAFYSAMDDSQQNND